MNRFLQLGNPNVIVDIHHNINGNETYVTLPSQDIPFSQDIQPSQDVSYSQHIANTAKLLHIFICSDVYYDTAGFSEPTLDQIRVLINPIILHDTKNNILLQILTIIHSGIKVVVDVSCCSHWTISDGDNHLMEFLDFIIIKNGNIRFSDFALCVAKKYLFHADIDFDFDTVNDIHGKIEVHFEPTVLKSSNFKDLITLGEIAPSGKITINTLNSTRRMVISPEYLKKCNIYLKKSDNDVPILVSIHHQNSDIQLMSCHYSEIIRISDIDTNKLLDIIRLERGQEYANRIEHMLMNCDKNKQMCYKEASQLLSSLSPS